MPLVQMRPILRFVHAHLPSQGLEQNPDPETLPARNPGLWTPAAQNRPFHARNRGLWIPDSSTAPNPVQHASVQPCLSPRNPCSGVHPKTSPLQATSIPPDYLQEVTENAHEPPSFIHKPPFHAHRKRRIIVPAESGSEKRQMPFLPIENAGGLAFRLPRRSDNRCNDLAATLCLRRFRRAPHRR